MFWNKRERVEDKEMDRVGESVLWSASVSDEEAGRVAGSPFLYARVAARIEEQKRRAEPADAWRAIFAEARRATATLALVAVVASAVFWFSAGSAPGPPAAVVKANANSGEVIVSACSLSSAEECAISNDDVLATMFANEGEK